MADTAETNGNEGRPSQGSEVCSASAFPDHQSSKRASSDSGSLKQPRKKIKTRSPARCAASSRKTCTGRAPGVTSVGSVKSGSNFKLPKPKIDLKAFFDYYFVRKEHKKQQHKKRKQRWLREKETVKYKRRKKPPKRRWPKIPGAERQKRFRERGLQFPFVEKLCGRKHIPLKLVCRYEHAALEGYFRYIETLKCEHHLKKSLAKLNAGDDLENESLESRKYKYLDDDGPLSPMEETTEEDQNDNSGSDEIGAKIVEKSCFILSSKIPERKQPKKKSR